MRKSALRTSALLAGAALATMVACRPDEMPTAPSTITSLDQTLDVTVPDQDTPGEPLAHVDFVRGITRSSVNPHAGSNPNLIYHGGPVMRGTAAVTAIFWGTSWNNPGDKISGMGSFYGGISGSGYIKTNNEYTDGSGSVTSTVSYASPIIDLSAAPRHAPRTSAILAEVCSQISNPTAGGYYAVYVDTPRGHAGYCAWHSAGTCGGTPVEFAFFFNLDGDPGCDPQSNENYSQGLAALANVSGHELSEALTDPQLNAWYDASGAENADKCAWTFRGTVSFGTNSNYNTWKIQGNWSNAAFTAGTGYANGGCIQTK